MMHSSDIFVFVLAVFAFNYCSKIEGEDIPLSSCKILKDFQGGGGFFTRIFENPLGKTWSF